MSDNNVILEHEVMTELVQKFTTPPSLYFSKYFPTPPSAKILGQTAQWDTLLRGRGMANYVARDGEANLASRLVIKNNSFTVAFKKEKKAIEGSIMALLRQPGTTDKQYGEQAVRDELEDLLRMILFRNEWENAQALQGTLTVSQSNNVAFTVDYGIDATHKPTVTVSFSDTNCDIVEYIMAWKKIIAEDSGEVPIDVTVNSVVMKYIIKNVQVQKFMGIEYNRQIGETGRITRFLDLNWHVYDSGYVNSSNVFVPYMPITKLLMATEPNFGKRIIGASLDIKSGFKPGRFSKSWTTEDPATTFVLVEENSLPCIEKVENLIMATVKI